jgi:hypothetical protein
MKHPDDAMLQVIQQLNALKSSCEDRLSSKPLLLDYRRGIDIYSMSTLIKVMANTMRAFKSVHGVYPSMLVPQGFNQKIFYRKFFEPLQVGKVGNKLSTSFFIPADLQNDLTCPTLVWRSEEPFLPTNDEIPAGNYYLKANHGSNFYCKIRYPLTQVQRLRLEDECKRWLKSNYGVSFGEWWYNVFKKEVFIEKDISPEKPAISFNFFVVSGEAVFICMHLKQTNEELYLDIEFNPIHDNLNKRKFMRILHSLKQETREKLIMYASKIGAAFSFVRVDFFIDCDEQIYLAELTLSPGNGLVVRPDGFDEKLGDLWKL